MINWSLSVKHLATLPLCADELCLPPPMVCVCVSVVGTRYCYMLMHAWSSLYNKKKIEKMKLLICLGRPYIMQMVIHWNIIGIPFDQPIDSIMQRVSCLFPYRYCYFIFFLQLVRNFRIQHLEESEQLWKCTDNIDNESNNVSATDK